MKLTKFKSIVQVESESFTFTVPYQHGGRERVEGRGINIHQDPSQRSHGDQREKQWLTMRAEVLSFLDSIV